MTVRVTNRGSFAITPAIRTRFTGSGLTLAPSPEQSAARTNAAHAYRIAVAQDEKVTTAASRHRVQQALAARNDVTSGVQGLGVKVAIRRDGGVNTDVSGGRLLPGRSTTLRWRWRVNDDAKPGRRVGIADLSLPHAPLVSRSLRFDIRIAPTGEP